jgi:hypothetical protein
VSINQLNNLAKYAIFTKRYTRVQYRNVGESFLRWGYKTNDFILDNYNEIYNIEINTATKINAVILDIDNPDDYNRPREIPTIITKNRDNEKRHELFYLENPYFMVNNKLKRTYNQYKKKLYNRTNTDTNFKNRTTKNFLNPYYHTECTGELIESIFDVSNVIYPKEYKNAYNDTKIDSYANKWTPNDYISAIANGMSLFSAYFFDSIRDNIQLRNNSTQETFRKAMESQADVIIDTIRDDGFVIDNSSAAKVIDRIITESEIAHLNFKKRQSDKSKIANNTRWGTRADSEQRIIDTYQEMKKEGVKISKTSLSKRVGISRETISRRYKDLWQDLDT